MLRLFLAAGAAITVPGAVMALSEAASHVVAQEVGAACGGGGGRYDPAYVMERDLDGDGGADLLVGHEGIECAPTGRSAECGMLLCSIRVYLRRGELLVLALDDLQGFDLAVGAGPAPEIRWVGSGGAPFSIRWDGSAFR